MSIQPDQVEVDLRTVHVCPVDQRTAAVIAPRDPADGCALSVDLGKQEAQVARELGGGQTSRSQAIALANRIAGVLQGRLVGVLLIQCHPGCLRAAIQVRPADALVEVPTEPRQALAAAVSLHIPLRADRRLWERGDARSPDPWQRSWTPST